jgi:hypothetical protein
VLYTCRRSEPTPALADPRRRESVSSRRKIFI